MPGVNSNSDDAKKWLEELLGDVSKSSATKQLAIGTASGWLTGYVAMKFGKVVAIAAGGSIILLQVAQHKGYININWDKVTKTADKVVDKIQEEATGKGPSAMDKLERFVDRKINKAEKFVDRHIEKAEGKGRSWFGALVNNGSDSKYDLQELHIFLLSYIAGVAVGIATG